MRLLDTSTLTLHQFYDDAIPPYAILSHTWGQAEVSFHDLQVGGAKEELYASEGYTKIKACCALAASQGHKHVWIDTCCIDKSSSAELSEAINSMYRWYQGALVCYAYLADISIRDTGLLGLEAEREFHESRWFTRGWTLQELLAPKDVVFYDKNWREFGSKSSLKTRISLITGIQQSHLADINRASAAQKMSWASNRKTTRVEDLAYSLMGIFDVNMPLLYGEGKKAFVRLQHEFIKISDDESIFAWTDADLVESGIFALSPKAFEGSGDVVQVPNSHLLHVRRGPYMVTNRGLAIEIFADTTLAAVFVSKRGNSFLPLNCTRQSELGVGKRQHLLVIELTVTSRDEFVRTSPGLLKPPLWLLNRLRTSLIYIRPNYVNASEQLKQSFIINALSTSVLQKLCIVETYGCRPRIPETWKRNQHGQGEEKTWAITPERNQGFVALLYKYSQHDPSQTVCLILRAPKGVCIPEFTHFSIEQDFRKEMDGYSQGYHPGLTQISKRPPLDDHTLYVDSIERERMAPGEWTHYVTLRWDPKT